MIFIIISITRILIFHLKRNFYNFNRNVFNYYQSISNKDLKLPKNIKKTFNALVNLTNFSIQN